MNLHYLHVWVHEPYFTMFRYINLFFTMYMFRYMNLIFTIYKGDGGVGTFDVGGWGACLHFWFKSSNFLGARLIRVRNSYDKIKLNFNDL